MGQGAGLRKTSVNTKQPPNQLCYSFFLTPWPNHSTGVTGQVHRAKTPLWDCQLPPCHHQSLDPSPPLALGWRSLLHVVPPFGPTNITVSCLQPHLVLQQHTSLLSNRQLCVLPPSPPPEITSAVLPKSPSTWPQSAPPSPAPRSSKPQPFPISSNSITASSNISVRL